MVLPIISILDIFIPPPVLPAHAPINIRTTRIVSEKTGQRSKSTVENPVVDISDATVKAECFIDSPTEEYIE